MSKQYPGGIISKNPVIPSGSYINSTASGIWTLEQQAYWQKLGQWPNPANPAPDAQFNYVTLLLHGDGTNGAQNNTFLDSSTNNLSIIRQGNTTQGSFSPYGSNWGNYFAYNSTAVNYLVSSSVSLSGTFTIEGYVYWDGAGSNANMFTLGDSSLSTGLEVYISGGNWVMWSNASQRIAGSAAVVGQWTYISVSRTGSTVTMYINGVSQGTWTSSATFSGTVKIGAEYYASVYYSSMSGYISNFRINNTTAINTVPTAPLTAVSGTVLLTCQSNRFVDNSASPLTITVNGTPSVQRFNPFGASTAYSTSVIGGSGYFDGSGDYLTIANNAAFKFGTGDYTIEFWLFYNAYGTFATSIRTDGASPQWVLQSDSGVMDYYVNGSVILAESSAPSLSSWNHYAVVRSGSGTNNTKMYRNGVQVAQATNNTDIQPTSQVVIGSGGDSNIASFGLNGYLSNIRVVKGTAVYTAAFTPPTAPLTAITNTSLLTNFTNGAIFDNAMINDLETAGTAQISTSVVKYGTGSINNNGTTSFPGGTATKLICRPNPSFSFGTGDFTVEGWFYQTTIGSTYQSILEINNHLGADGILFIGNTGGVACVYAAGTGGGGFVAQQATTANVWQHIAFVRNNGTLRTYVNGVSTSSQAGFTLDIKCTIGLTIGGERTGDGNYNYYGYMDEFRVTRYARYTANFTPPTAAFLNIGPT